MYIIKSGNLLKISGNNSSIGSINNSSLGLANNSSSSSNSNSSHIKLS